MKKPLNWLFSLALVLLTFNMSAGIGQAQPAAPVASNYCRFGIGVSNGLEGYDLSTLGVGSFLDWGVYRDWRAPSNIQFFHVIKVSDEKYAQMLALVPSRVAQNPGAVWIIGNEPDSEVNYQDHLTAERYAERYFEMANLIRSKDPTAILVFGTVIQATPVRLYYLELALKRLDALTGSRDNTRALIDVFATHNFLLNETPIYFYDENGKIEGVRSWGAGIPLGYKAGVWPEPYSITIDGVTDETWKTHNSAIFAERIQGFRAWMLKESMRDKPLWVTEFGTLFPSESRGGLLTVSEADSAKFMQETFDFLLTATDPNTGYAADGNRLVQNFTWFSLNEPLWRFGGALYNPDNHKLTLMGERFISYDPPAGAADLRKPADLDILEIQDKSPVIIPLGPGSGAGLVNYMVILRGSNNIASEFRTQSRMDLSANGAALTPQSQTLPRCGGQSIYIFTLNDRQPGETITFSARINLLAGNNGPETDPSNDTLTFTRTLPGLNRLFQPFIGR